MNSEILIQNTIAFAKDRLRHDTTGHDWPHTTRVLRHAKKINAIEKADELIVMLAVLLHDVGDRKVLGTKENDYSIARNFLESQQIDADTINAVMEIIETMSFSVAGTQKRTDATKEFKVVQDADRLEALGAIGIARTFTYSGAHGRPMFDEETRGVHDSSALQHFDDKLLLVKDLLNTEGAKKVAKELHDFLLLFKKQFLKEWLGEENS